MGWSILENNLSLNHMPNHETEEGDCIVSSLPPVEFHHVHDVYIIMDGLVFVFLCEDSKNEAREIRTPNLLIWSQTRCRCAIAPLMSPMICHVYRPRSSTTQLEDFLALKTL